MIKIAVIFKVRKRRILNLAGIGLKWRNKHEGDYIKERKRKKERRGGKGGGKKFQCGDRTSDLSLYCQFRFLSNFSPCTLEIYGWYGWTFYIAAYGPYKPYISWIWGRGIRKEVKSTVPLSASGFNCACHTYCKSLFS